ncbi:MAG: Cytochrome peroxidase precursor, partial [Pseudomonadota bacterium]
MGGAPVDTGLTDSAAPLPVADPSAPTGSQAVAASASGRALTSVLVDEGAVVRVDLDTGERSLLVTGDQPTRVARFGGALVVSLRGARALAVLSADGPLVEERRVEVGAEPVGLVAARDGGHLYVALYGSDEVVELDASLQVTRRIPVGGRPSWLALHPGGRWLAVGAQIGGVVSVIDLELEQPVPSSLPLPGLFIPDREDGDRPLSVRVTGDLSFSEDGAQLAAPLLYVDNTAVPNHTAEEALERDPAERYQRIGLGLSPNNPVVALWSTGDGGAVEPASVLLRNAVGEAPTGVDGATLVARSFLSGVVFSPDGALVLAPMESGAAVVALPTSPAAPLEAGEGLASAGGLWLGAGAGARGLAVLAEDDVWVYNFIDATLQQLPADALDAAAATGGGPVRAQGRAGAPVALLEPADGVQL